MIKLIKLEIHTADGSWGKNSFAELAKAVILNTRVLVAYSLLLFGPVGYYKNIIRKMHTIETVRS
jgi:hypothetical protein